MFTSRSILAAFRQTLEMLAILVVILAFRAPETLKILAGPFFCYVSDLYADATHQKTGNPVPEHVFHTPPAGIAGLAGLSSLKGAFGPDFALPIRRSTSTNQENGEGSDKSDVTPVQDQPRGHLGISLKLNQDEILNRFQAGIAVPVHHVQKAKED